MTGRPHLSDTTIADGYPATTVFHRKLSEAESRREVARTSQSQVFEGCTVIDEQHRADQSEDPARSVGDVGTDLHSLRRRRWRDRAERASLKIAD